MTDYRREDDEYEELKVSEGGGMSFLEHLEDFRWTVGRSVLAFITGIVLATLFIGDIADFLKLPIVTAYGSAEMADENLITYRPMGVISVFIQIAFLSGLTLSMPFVLYFLAAFVAPGLTDKERKVVRPACFAAFLLFLTGVSLATGAFFQFPLIIVILVYLGVIPVQRLKDIRREVLVGLMVFAAFMTPGGDFVSLPLITGFMYGLYELAIWVGIRVEKKRQEELEEWDIE